MKQREIMDRRFWKVAKRICTRGEVIASVCAATTALPTFTTDIVVPNCRLTVYYITGSSSMR